MNKLCISVRSLRRSSYLRKCLASLEAQDDLDGVDFYMFQDGAVNRFSGKRYATDKEVAASLAAFRGADLPNKTIYVSPDNVGSSIQKRHQLRTLFPRYEHVVLVDNDLVFNRFYVSTLKALFRQFAGDLRAGIVQTSFRHRGTNLQGYARAQMMADKVSYGFSHRWEMGFWRESWKRIAPFMEPFFELTAACDFKALVSMSVNTAAVRRNLWKQYRTIWADQALETSARRAGYRGVHTLAHRHRTIGRKGIYSTTRKFDNLRFGAVALHNVGRIGKYTVV